MYRARGPPRRLWEEGVGTNMSVVAINGERIEFRTVEQRDLVSIQGFIDRAWDEVDSLRHTHGIHGTLRDAARIYVEEGGIVNPINEGDNGILLVHISCVWGGLGNAFAYALIQGECDGLDHWRLLAFGRREQEGDVLLSARVRPSERHLVLEGIAQIRNETSMGRGGTARGHLQGTRRRPGINNMNRYTSEDEDEGDNSLEGRGGRAPPPGERISTRRGGNHGSTRRDRQLEVRGQRTGVRDESPEPRPRRGQQSQVNPRRETENGRSRGIASANTRGTNLEDVDDPHPGWRDIPDEGSSGGGPAPPAYRTTAPDAAGGGGRRGAGGRRR